MKLLKVTILLIFFSNYQLNSQSLTEKYEAKYHKGIFLTSAWWLYTGVEIQDTSKLNPIQKVAFRHMDSCLTESQGAFFRDLRKAFKTEFDFYSDYLLVVLGLNTTDPPEFTCCIQELIEYNEAAGIQDNWTVSKLRLMEPYLEQFRRFYREAGIESLYGLLQPWYEKALKGYQNNARVVIAGTLEYLRLENEDFTQVDRVVIIPNPLSGSGEMGPSYRGVIYDVKCHFDDGRYVFYPHEMIHSLIGHLTKSPEYKELIMNFVQPHRDEIVSFEAIKSYHDPVIFFDECLVRAIDLTLVIGRDTEEKKKKLAEALQKEEKNGFIFVEELAHKLHAFEESNLSFEAYFSEFLR